MRGVWKTLLICLWAFQGFHLQRLHTLVHWWRNMSPIVSLLAYVKFSDLRWLITHVMVVQLDLMVEHVFPWHLTEEILFFQELAFSCSMQHKPTIFQVCPLSKEAINLWVRVPNFPRQKLSLLKLEWIMLLIGPWFAFLALSLLQYMKWGVNHSLLELYGDFFFWNLRAIWSSSLVTVWNLIQMPIICITDVNLFNISCILGVSSQDSARQCNKLCAVKCVVPCDNHQRSKRQALMIRISSDAVWVIMHMFLK